MIDFDSASTSDEATYNLHQEHADCWCEVCERYRKTLLEAEDE